MREQKPFLVTFEGIYSIKNLKNLTQPVKFQFLPILVINSNRPQETGCKLNNKSALPLFFDFS